MNNPIVFDVQVQMPTDRQEALNAFIRHMANQKCRSWNGTMCMYRDGKGNGCGIGGPFIPDNLYRPWMDARDSERKMVESIDTDFVAWYNEGVFLCKEEDIAFFSDIQKLHDQAYVKDRLVYRIQEFATEYALDASLVSLITEWDG